MYTDLIAIYDKLKKTGVEDPLAELLYLVDILSRRAVRQTDLSGLTQNGMTYGGAAQKRKEGVPWEYIIGEAPFFGRMFYCSPDTLIPREETELLTRVALDLIKAKQAAGKKLTLIDMGTGCGNIAVSLALGCRKAHVLASDLSPETVAVARKNVERHQVKNRVTLFHGDLFSPLGETAYQEKIDMVVCNPPYIPTGSLQKLAPEIIGHEPREAFDAGAFGINIFSRLIKGALLFLKPGGILVFEIGAGQEKLVTRLFDKSGGYSHLAYHPDHLDQIRVISAEKNV